MRLVKLDKAHLLKATQGPGAGGDGGLLSRDIEVFVILIFCKCYGNMHQYRKHTERSLKWKRKDATSNLLSWTSISFPPSCQVLKSWEPLTKPRYIDQVSHPFIIVSLFAVQVAEVVDLVGDQDLTPTKKKSCVVRLAKLVMLDKIKAKDVETDVKMTNEEKKKATNRDEEVFQPIADLREENLTSDGMEIGQ